jgi:hypothetical protein
VQFAADHADDCAAIIYHVWWPASGDPFYQHNPAENTGRTNYYGLSHVPTELFDGRLEPDEAYGYAELEEVYAARKAVPTDVTLEIAGVYDESTGDLVLTVSASTSSPLPTGDYRLHVVLTESGLYYEAANGIDWHEYTMRDMVADHEGQPVTFAGDPPQGASVEVEFALDPLYLPANCEIVCFLQDHEVREVWQVAKARLSELLATDVVAGAASIHLGAAYPNPFNPGTRIPVSLRERGHLRLDILSARGRLIRVLHRGELPAGRREFLWDGRDDADRPVPSGVYLSRLEAAGSVRSRRLVLLK